MIGGIVDLW